MVLQDPTVEDQDQALKPTEHPKGLLKMASSWAVQKLYSHFR